jgi:hypothetical protein
VLLLNVFSSRQISQRVFELIRSENPSDALSPEVMSTSRLDASVGLEKVDGCPASGCSGKTEAGNPMAAVKEDRSKSVPFELYKRRTTILVRRKTFLDVVCDALAEYKYVGPNQRQDLVLACRYIKKSYIFWEYILVYTHLRKW